MFDFFGKKPEGDEDKGNKVPVRIVHEDESGQRVEQKLHKITKVEVFHCRGCEQELEKEHAFGATHSLFWCNNRSCDEFGYMVVVGIKRDSIDWK